MAVSFKVAQKYQVTNSEGVVETYFVVDGKNPDIIEQKMLEDLKDELGWPIFIYEGHVEDHWGNVVQ